MGAHTTTAAAPAIAEVLKIAPIGISLSVYGFTLQEWTILFGCLYAFGLLMDLVLRRWTYPLVRHLLERRAARKAKNDAD